MNTMKLLDAFEDLCLARDLSKGTRENYRRAIRYLNDYVGKDLDCKELNHRLVNGWLARCEDQYDPQYVRSLRRDLLVVWNHAADLEACEYPKNRLIRLSALPEKTPEAWPLEWMNQLLEGCRKLRGKVRGSNIERRYYAEAYFRVQFELLCRPTDMRHLLWCQLEGETIEFVQNKTRRKFRGALSDDARFSLSLIRGLHDQVIFPLRKTATELMIRRVFELSGIEKPKGQSLGHVRHTGGSVIAKQCGNDKARASLGHTPNSTVFEKHYLDPRFTERDTAKANLWWAG